MAPTRTTSAARGCRSPRASRSQGSGRWRTVAGAGAGGLAALLSATPLPEAAYLDGPPPAHAGSPGGDTCHVCHFDNDRDAPGGSLTLTGVPDAFDPPATYRITVTVARPGIRRGGFQLSARVAEGNDAGRQAGILRTLPGDERVQVIEGPDAVVYAQHTASGTALTGSETTSWTVEWSPPDTGRASITLHAAANAGNDDASEFGDFIYTATATTRPAMR